MMSAPPAWLPLAVLGAKGLASVVRVIQLRAAKVNAVVVFDRGSDARALLGRVFGIAVALTVLFAVLFAVKPDIVQALGPIAPLEAPALGWTGAVLAAMGVVLVTVAQFDMGGSWRIGIPRDGASALVTDGLYRFSRNPIYVGMLAGLAGIFLMAPNALTLALLSTSLASVAIQVRIEESYLRDLHGIAFELYCARTRRWV